MKPWKDKLAAEIWLQLIVMAGDCEVLIGDYSFFWYSQEKVLEYSQSNQEFTFAVGA